MKKRLDNHIAEGEATGHYHGVEGEGVAVYDLDDQVNGPKTLEAPNGAAVFHQEHNRFTLPPGEYDVSGVVESDPFEDAVRRVAD